MHSSHQLILNKHIQFKISLCYNLYLGITLITPEISSNIIEINGTVLKILVEWTSATIKRSFPCKLIFFFLFCSLLLSTLPFPLPTFDHFYFSRFIFFCSFFSNYFNRLHGRIQRELFAFQSYLQWKQYKLYLRD